MVDFRTLYDKEHLGSWDLQGRDVTVTIEWVRQGKAKSKDGKEAKKPLIKFRGKEKTFLCNVTNGNTIAAMYGPDVKEWTDKRITLYGSTTSVGGATVDCIRIRPGIPKGKDTPALADTGGPTPDEIAAIKRRELDEAFGRQPGEEG